MWIAQNPCFFGGSLDEPSFSFKHSNSCDRGSDDSQSKRDQRLILARWPGKCDLEVVF
jgi:hypothetical protein